MKLVIHSNAPLRFSPLFIALALCFPFPGRAENKVVNSTDIDVLGNAISSAVEGDNITISSGTSFTDNHISLSIVKPNLTLQGGTASGFGSGVANLTYTILQQANGGKDVSAASLSSLVGGWTAAYASDTDGAALSSISLSSGNTRSPINKDYFYNTTKLLSVANSGAGGLSLENLRFSGVNVTYSASRIVNGLIGNINTALADSSLGNLRGNAFTDLSVSLNGTVASQYMAGGGIIGIRSVQGSASIGDISGNVFKGLNVNITDSAGATTGTGSGTSAYLEGGGIIGVDGVSSPASMSGRASINSLSNNLFTGIKVHSGDMLLGGGLVGVNNNSNNQDANTFARLGRVSGNVFGNGVSSGSYDIDVDIGYSIRGGGVIGVNGFSNATVSLDGLDGNVFNGISVKTTSYLKGGGVVGLQTQYVENDLSTKTDSPGDYPDDSNNAVSGDDTKFSSIAVTAVDQYSASAGVVENNLFLNTQVETGSYLSGGGIIGLRANTGFASLAGLTNNIFKGLVVNVGSDDNGNNLNGGGIVGVSSGRYAAFGTGTAAASGNYFDELNVTVTGGNLNGGGIIGVQYGDSATPSSQGFALVNDIKDNTFKSLSVTTVTTASGDITGGGIVGMSGQSAVGNLEGFTGFSGNRFDSLVVSSAGSLSGGGIVGAYSTGGSVSINAFTGNSFTSTASVTSANALTGGGIVGVYAGTGTAGMTGISNNQFGGLTVSSSASTLSGGGVVGAYSGSGSAGFVGVTGNAFADTTVTSGALSGGGVVGAYSSSGGVDIENLDGNTFTRIGTAANALNGGGVVGVATTGSGIVGIAGIANNRFSEITVNLTGTLSGGGIVGAYSSSGLAVIEGFRNNLLENNQVTAAGNVDGGIVGIRGVQGAAGSIDGSVFRGNTVTSSGGDVLGGLFYSSGLAGGLTISDSLFTDNTFNASYSGKRAYGAVTVDTGVAADAGDSDHNTLTLRASAGKTTVFSNNVIDDDYTGSANISIEPADSRRNALYFGAFSNNGTALSGATLNIDAQAGGAVVLDDPIQADQGSSDQTFTMNVTGQGDFIWDGDNIFGVNSTDEANAVNLRAGSKTTLQSGFRLDAVNHAFNVEAGGRLNVMGHDEMWVDEANLNGELYFNLNGTAVNDSSAPLLKIHTNTGNASVAGSTVILSDFSAASPLLQTGDEFYLIEGDAGKLVGDPANDHAAARVGLTRRYDFVIDRNPTGVAGDDTWLVARLLGMDVAPEARVLLEGRTASLVFLGQRAGWLADHSYQSADMAFAGHDNGRSWAPFAGADIAWVRIDTGGGSRLNIDAGTTVLAGAATRDKTAERAVLLGVFIEGGYADYRTRDHFPDQGTIKGSGTLKSLGGGFMGRVEWENGFRLEGSLRAGKQESKFHSRDYRDVDGVQARYDFHSPYLGAHVGLAHTWKIDERNLFDLLGRYFWVRQQGGHTVLSTGERVKFEDDESRRLRIGGRFTHVRDERASWYGGVAIEHEFDGRARGSAHGHVFDSPKLTGTSGIFDVGVIFRPAQDKPYSIETGLQAYVGKIRGISGGVRIGREF